MEKHLLYNGLPPSYDTWKTTPPESKIVGECDHCGAELYEGETALKVYVNNEVICHRCLEDYAKEHLDIVDIEL